MRDKAKLLQGGIKDLKCLRDAGFTIPTSAIREMRKLISQSPYLSIETIEKRLKAIYKIVMDYKTTRVKNATRVR